MPFRSQHTLEAWLDEFGRLGYPLGTSLKVIQQDGDGGADTGLVGVALGSSPTGAYIQPERVGSTRWVVTFEPRDTPVVLDSAALMHLSSELATVSALCAFLQAKSNEFAGEDEA